MTHKATYVCVPKPRVPVHAVAISEDSSNSFQARRILCSLALNIMVQAVVLLMMGMVPNLKISAAFRSSDGSNWVGLICAVIEHSRNKSNFSQGFSRIVIYDSL